MINPIDISPLRALAKRASAHIEDPIVASRFEALAIKQLTRDIRNFRPARDSDIESAPQWAKDAYGRGETLQVARVNRAIAARIHTIANRLLRTCKVAASDPMARPEHISEILAARKFLSKLGNADFDTVARKALTFSRVLDVWEEHLDSLALCPARSIALLGGRMWHRITSVGALRRIGDEFENCLARSTRASAYGALLARGRAQFWVLRTVDGEGLIVAMASTDDLVQFAEVKGPGNALVCPNNPDLLLLGLAIGIRPAPPAPAPASRWGAALALATRAPCRCSLCAPCSGSRP